MTKQDFARLLEAMLQGARTTSVTLTELPPLAGDLSELIEDAIVAGGRHGTRLTQIQLPVQLAASVRAAFEPVAIVESGAMNVMRLFFQPEEGATAAPAE